MIQYKDIWVDTEAGHVYRQGKEVPVTRIEYRLLLELLRSGGRVITRSELLRRVWGVTVPLRTRTVDIHIARLRRKLGLKGELLTVMGKGYALGRPDR